MSVVAATDSFKYVGCSQVVCRVDVCSAVTIQIRDECTGGPCVVIGRVADIIALVGEGPVPVIDPECILTNVCDKQIRKSVSIRIADCDTLSKLRFNDLGVGNFNKASATDVAKQSVVCIGTRASSFPQTSL